MLTAFLFVLLVLYIDPHYWLGYGIFFSALIVTIRTDFETMLISRYMTLSLIPVGILLSALELLPLSVMESVLGALFGYIFLWLVAHIFQAIRKIEGLGEGDLDLLAMIGSFTGIVGTWIALFLGAFLGSCVGIFLMLKYKKYDIAIAFGPWLAFGALISVFTKKFFLALLI